MKIIQINTVLGIGSTGRTCVELESVLIDRDIESFIAFGYGSSVDRNHYQIGSKIDHYLHNICSRIFGVQGFFSKRSTKKFIRYLRVLNPDIIHLRNLHGNYLNYELLFKYLNTLEIPVIWTLHDCWPYTGKCVHYTAVSCDKWKSQCENCPQIKKYPPSLFLDRSRTMYDKKKELFTSLKNGHILTVSDWLAKEVSLSYLNKYPIKRIYNWIDTETFTPLKDGSKLKVMSRSKFNVLGVSAGWNTGDSKLADFISLSEMLTSEYQIVLLGALGRGVKLPNNIIHIPFVSSKKDLAKIYSEADVYVHLSIEDTFGKVIAEALSCGTPVIGYNSTAIPELFDKNCGFVVPVGNLKLVVDSIEVIRAKGKDYYSSYCVDYVNDKFSYSKNSNQIVEFYNSVMK